MFAVTAPFTMSVGRKRDYEFRLLVHYHGAKCAIEVAADRAVAYHDPAVPTISTDKSSTRWKEVFETLKQWIRLQQVCARVFSILKLISLTHSDKVLTHARSQNSLQTWRKFSLLFVLQSCLARLAHSLIYVLRLKSLSTHRCWEVAVWRIFERFARDSTSSVAMLPKRS